MSSPFDPYQNWLGIRESERPPNHYRLLGLEVFEGDPCIIDGAADRQMAHVRTFQAGRHSQHSQRILNEIAQARTCLLSPHRKDEYDTELRKARAQFSREARSTPVPCPVAIDFGASHQRNETPFVTRNWLRLGSKRVFTGALFAIVGLVAVAIVASGFKNPSAAEVDDSQQTRRTHVVIQNPASKAARRNENRVSLDQGKAITEIASGSKGESREGNRATRPAPPAVRLVSKKGLAEADESEEDPFGSGIPKTNGSNRSSDDTDQPSTKNGSKPASESKPKKQSTAADGSASHALPKLGPVELENDTRHPEPDEASRLRAEKQIREIYSDAVTAATRRDAKVDLAKRFYGDALAITKDPVDRYVLLEHGKKLALGGNDAKVFSSICDALSKHYRVDGLKEHFAGLKVLAENVPRNSRLSNEQLLAEIQLAINRNVVAEQYEDAIELARVTVDIATRLRDGDLKKRLVETGRDLVRMNDYFKEAKQAILILQNSREDPESNMKLGRYLTLVRGQWETGLRYLAKGNHAELREVATMDLADPKQAGLMMEVGNAWFAIAKPNVGHHMEQRLMERATHWYKKALPELTGLNRRQVEDRLKVFAEKNILDRYPGKSSPESSEDFEPIRFDCGPEEGPVAKGYQKITPTSHYEEETGYGWLLAPSNAFVRTASVDAVEVDLVSGKKMSFRINVPAGDYDFTLFLGDSGRFAHDKMEIRINSKKLSEVSTRPSEVKQLSFPVFPSNGSIVLDVTDLGGADPWATIIGMSIVSRIK